MKRILVASILALSAMVASAQTPVVTQAVSQTVFNALAGPINTCTKSATIRNINQSSHTLFWTTTGGPPSVLIYLVGSFDGVNWQPITRSGVLDGGVLQTGSYFPQVQAWVCLLSGGATLTAWYSGAGGPTDFDGQAGQAVPIGESIVTFTPINYPSGGAGTFLTTNLVSARQAIVSTTASVLMGATVFNPNASPVYVAFLPTNGGAISTSLVMIAIPANGSLVLPLPPQGIYFPTSGMYASCSSSNTSFADPGSACTVNAWFKPLTQGAIPY